MIVPPLLLTECIVRGFYWSVICCCSSIGTILCNTLSRAVHGNPSSIFYALSIANLCNAFASYSLYPSKRPEEVIPFNHPFYLDVLRIHRFQEGGV